eukprot:scaffold529_cov308-Pinguiococcus_pyrenoidosus.AAC.51
MKRNRCSRGSTRSTRARYASPWSGAASPLRSCAPLLSSCSGSSASASGNPLVVSALFPAMKTVVLLFFSSMSGSQYSPSSVGLRRMASEYLKGRIVINAVHEDDAVRDRQLGVEVLFVSRRAVHQGDLRIFEVVLRWQRDVVHHGRRTLRELHIMRARSHIS